MKTQFDVIDIDEPLLCERMKINKNKSLQERRRSMFARCLLYYVLEKECNIKSCEIELIIGKFGKPSIEDSSGINFNISHSGEFVCCAISPSKVGVDIQKVDEINLEISNRFFTQNEDTYIMSGSKINMMTKFYDIWSCKEAYIKMLGYGLSKPLNSFEIKEKEGFYSIIDEGIVEKCNLILNDYSSNYKLAVCYKTQKVKITTIKNKEVFEFISNGYLKN